MPSSVSPGRPASLLSAPGSAARRAALAALVLLPLTACGASAPAEGAGAARSELRTAADAPTASTTRTPVDVSKELRALERKFDARIGLHALNTGTGEEITHRADERFAHCSTFKSLAAGALLATHSPAERERVVTYTEDDLVEHSPVTEKHVDTGMTLNALAAATLRESDNTAVNLLLEEALGGPKGLESHLREELGDRTTNIDRYEPGLSDGTPGDKRDTSTARALSADLRALLLGDALNKRDRAQLTDWMHTNITGDTLIRAGVPDSWKVADKSGAGGYGTRNNIAVAWPDEGEPIVISVLSSKDREGAEREDELVAEAAEIVADAIG
ncbi:class A beta-lactamase [Streptomyces sp. XM4193]|uniref:class A beta-lactamase n=1 Tax=Streptomyces sp. XM4193 TaxID=2929782 RepID=UPI001FFB9AD9|nr:class A beta-lactamase [Streptomyces sp. XM4193]MCK1796657.1 class A beta-lactamase [Streptomyces sp. XM4193]